MEYGNMFVAAVPGVHQKFKTRSCTPKYASIKLINYLIPRMMMMMMMMMIN